MGEEATLESRWSGAGELGVVVGESLRLFELPGCRVSTCRPLPLVLRNDRYMKVHSLTSESTPPRSLDVSSPSSAPGLSSLSSMICCKDSPTSLSDSPVGDPPSPKGNRAGIFTLGSSSIVRVIPPAKQEPSLISTRLNTVGELELAHKIPRARLVLLQPKVSTVNHEFIQISS